MEAFPSVATIAHAVRTGQVAPDHYVTESLARLKRFGGRLGAVISLGDSEVAVHLGALRSALERGDSLPLAGVPIAAKDNLCTRGWRTTAGSRILENYEPPYDATVIERLREAGAVIVAKTNLDEFAMGSSTENSAFFVARNPWDLERTPGGSSGGSAAAVAAGLVPVALGSDTGGSIRQPAAFTGTVGLKPTYGRVSRYGLIAFASSLDQIGPITRTVADAEAILSVLAGVDPRDATCEAGSPLSRVALHRDVKGLRIGLPAEALGPAIHAEVRARIRELSRRLADRGAKLVIVALPHWRFAIPAYYIVATAEASSNLARHSGIHAGVRAEGELDLRTTYEQSRGEGFGPEVQRRVLLGTFCLSAGYQAQYYGRATRVRALLRRDFDQAFAIADVLLMPTTPTPAFRLGEKVGNPIQMYQADLLTVAANLAGVPALSVPCGFLDVEGKTLPASAQVVGPAWTESQILGLGSVIEEIYPESQRLPEVAESVG